MTRLKKMLDDLWYGNPSTPLMVSVMLLMIYVAIAGIFILSYLFSFFPKITISALLSTPLVVLVWHYITFDNSED